MEQPNRAECRGGARQAAKDFQHLRSYPGWLNPNRVIRDVDGLSRRLHPGETVFGDYDGDILILGQEWTGTEFIAEDKLWENDEALATNKRTRALFAGQSGVFGNVLWHIKEGGISQPLHRLSSDLLDDSRVILDATFQAMPNLRLIFVQGKNAFQIFRRIYGGARVNTAYFDEFVGAGYPAICLPHLGGMGWANFRRGTGLSFEQLRDKVRVRLARRDTTLLGHGDHG